jgi:Mor family transcriptional regulator
VSHSNDPRPSNASQQDRNAEMIAKYDPDNNVGYRTLSKEYGISVGRVKQILNKAGRV